MCLTTCSKISNIINSIKLKQGSLCPEFFLLEHCDIWRKDLKRTWKKTADLEVMTWFGRVRPRDICLQ